MSRIGVFLLSVFLCSQGNAAPHQQRSSMNITCEKDELLHICTVETVQLTGPTEKPRIYLTGDVQNISHARIVESEIKTVTKELLLAFPTAATLELAELQITTIERGAFDNATQLKKLLLKSNNIGNLGPNVFSGLIELRDVSLENNQISQLPPGLFARNTKLETVSMKGNLLTRIESNIFNNVAGKMDFVDFSNNNLEHIDLSKSSEIISIDVSSNRLTEVKIPRVGLEILIASNNQINRIATNGENKQLTELNLSRNKLTSIAWLKLFPSLNILDLSNNEIDKVLPVHFPAENRLTELSLINNRLTTFDGMAATLKNLIVLDLSGNLLKSVDFSNPLYSKLEVLYLSRNSIVTLKLPANNSLWQLTVDDNDLSCANLRTHLPLLAKVVVRITDTVPCKAGYVVESDFCCRETDSN
ncbi:leucine-rich repeat-containing protein 70-like [Anopheles albimanus]|uniref:leucine-rich repeat-containing protein 70-like n=1 Tax=Anopheles albimanus TaxID=7167 RepID=UPI0016412EB4|nr:leucine-rich repeat-containing protein 70-like [Anopheles albimanus]